MRRVRSSIDINAPRGDIWRLISEFRHWPQWGPTVTAVRSTADLVAPGVEGSVRTPVGLWVPFQVTSVEPGVSWYWRVAGVEATGHELTNNPDGSTSLTFSAPWHFFPYQIVLEVGLRKVKAMAENPPVESAAMADHKGIEALVSSFKNTARAHHEATGGINPEWSDWYAARLVDDVNSHTQNQRTVDELSTWLAEADRRYRSESPNMSWPKAYANWLVEED